MKLSYLVSFCSSNRKWFNGFGIEPTMWTQYQLKYSLKTRFWLRAKRSGTKPQLTETQWIWGFWRFSGPRAICKLCTVVNPDMNKDSISVQTIRVLPKVTTRWHKQPSLHPPATSLTFFLLISSVSWNISCILHNKHVH